MNLSEKIAEQTLAVSVHSLHPAYRMTRPTKPPVKPWSFLTKISLTIPTNTWILSYQRN